MPIKPKNKIEIPAKEFDKLWSCKIEISAPMPGQEASACVTLLPYNDFGEVCESGIEVLNIDKIMEKSLDQSSNIAKAMYFLLLSIEDEYKKQNEEVIP